MNKNQSRNLVKEVFENSFEKDRFTVFIRELLNSYDDAPFIYRGNLIPDAYDKHISSFERVGKYSDGENKIDILIVNLKRGQSLERARTTQRNFIAWYLNGSRGGEQKDAALVAFVSPDSNDWRFSLIKMEYKFVESKSGKTKVKEEFTPAKRWSFLVGKNENSHTAQSRLAPIVEDDQNNPTLKQLEDAFNIEKVTKEFFEKYRALFLRTKESLDELVKNNEKLKQNFNEKSINTVDFSKKLLGQIVFLYFLQKKGWFGVPRGKDWGEGDKQFLRHLFEKAQKENKNYFNKFLEPLFYEALRLERPKDYYDQFDCRIPFLNGGLFDPINDYDWQDTDIILPNELFSNQIKDVKTGDIGTGILDIFDRYNFTVKEDEPLEKEVAVDPEMLGKVFENLLEVKDRKSKGTFYTPREIVHYMCQESLVNYLATELEGKVSKEDIETLIKHGETAVEHDAAYIEKKSKKEKTKVYSKAKLPKSIEKNARFIDEKLETIRVCDPAVGSGAFPVGMMNEIIRTRNALTPYVGKDAERTPYNFKRHAIQNSLYGVDIDPGAVEIAKLRLWLSLIVDEEDIKQIKPLPNLDYKIVQGNSLSSIEQNLFNQPLFAKLEELKPLFFNETSASKKREYKNQIDELISKITNNNQNFDFKIFFSEVFHEKKGFDVVIANPPYVNIFNIKNESFRNYLMKNYSVAKNKTDLYAFFVERGVEILKDKGKLAFIFSNSWLGTDSFSKFREFLIGKTKIEKLIKCPPGVFEEATVTVVIIILTKEIVTKNAIELLEFDGNKFQELNFKLSYDFIKGQVSYGFTFDKQLEIRIPYIKLSDVAKFSLGIKTADDERFVLDSKKDKDSYRLLRGKDISKYFKKFNGKWIWYKPDLMNQRKGAGPRKLEYFLRPKILIKDVAVEIQATLDIENYLTNDTVSILYEIKGLDLKFILALLNSRLINKWFKMNFPAGLHIKTNQLENIPVPKKVDEKPFIVLVDKILAITKDDDYLESPAKQAKVREYEKQIDQLVYKLYGLTPEEIKIVENS
jgi:hypothetical protein